MSEELLKPCPFCGNEQLLQFDNDVVCNDCGCTGPNEDFSGGWNTRAIDTLLSSPECEEAVTEAIEKSMWDNPLTQCTTEAQAAISAIRKLMGDTNA